MFRLLPRGATIRIRVSPNSARLPIRFNTTGDRLKEFDDYLDGMFPKEGRAEEESKKASSLQHTSEGLKRDNIDNTSDEMSSDTAKQGFASISFDKNDDFDILNDFINKEIEVTEDQAKSTENSDNSLSEGTEKDDKSIENDDFNRLRKIEDPVFDADFADQDMNQIVKDEKELFQYIFESYMKPMQHEQDEKKKKVHGLKESIRSTNERIGSLVTPRKSNELSKVSLRLRNKIFEKSKEAMAPTVSYIDSLGTTADIVQYYNEVISKWNELYEQTQQDKSAEENLNLTRLLKDATDFTSKHILFVDELHLASVNNPKFAELNVITLPIIINQIFKTLSFKFYDGQLPLTLFNILKKDITLYTMACNQETYNQILRILWIYHGKSNLYNIEMTFVEMKNNGFNGDLQTFNIMKQIIMDYYDLKMGKSQINKGTGLPIWSLEDDKRIRSLESRLKSLASTLKIQTAESSLW